MTHPILEFFNTLLHFEIISIITDCIFWVGVFLVGFPAAAVIALLRMLYQIVYFFIGHSNINPKKKEVELAVFITGCDSGEYKRAVGLRAFDFFLIQFAIQALGEH